MKSKTKTVFKPLVMVPAVVWFGLLIVSLAVSVLALRHNNLTAVSLLNQLYTADRNGTDVEQPLDKLQAYVTQHMNTNLATANGVYPPIQLANTYKRLTTQATSNTYHDAQIYCEKHQPVGYYGAYRLGCVESYIESHPSNLGSKPDIPAALYEFDFVSPAWSPDLAGWSLVASAVFFIAFLAKFLPNRVKVK